MTESERLECQQDVSVGVKVSQFGIPFLISMTTRFVVKFLNY